VTHDVIIIGGGVSGLATAHALMMRRFDVQVLERQKTAGGNAISERFNGFLMEHGPSTFNASVPDAVSHIDALGLLKNAQDLGPNVKRRYLRDQGKLTGISTHPMGFLLSGYLSPKARIAMMLEGFRPRNKSNAEETIHAFSTRRFGREFADKVIDPLAAGLFMGDAQKLSINGAFARLVDMENSHGSITRAIFKAKKGSAPGRHLYSWDGGIGTIPQLLSDRLGDRVHTGVAVLKLIKTSNGFEVQTTAGTRQTRAVVLATQPHVAAELIEYIDPDAADTAGEITAPPVNVVYFGYKREQVGHPLDGLGFLATKDTSRIVSGAQFCSTMYTGRAPDGYVSISAYAGGARNPDLAKISEAELVAQVHTELADLLNIKGDPVLHKTRRWALGLPQYALGHPARVEVLETTCERVPGLFVTGNYLQGVSVANCLNSAVQTAERVGTTLEGQNLLRSIPTCQQGFRVGA
jgi:protoporphyrinogen/coproporphyrinogen III oxidase